MSLKEQAIDVNCTSIIGPADTILMTFVYNKKGKRSPYKTLTGRGGGTFNFNITVYFLIFNSVFYMVPKRGGVTTC